MGWLLKLFTGGAAIWWIAGVAALAVGGYVVTTQVVLANRQEALDDALAASQKLAAEKATLTGQVDQLQRLNTLNLETLAQIRADHVAAVSDLESQIERARKAGTRLTVVRMENARDPDAARPLAEACPLLDRYLDRSLRDSAGAAAGADRDADRAGGGAAPRGAAAVPGRAGRADPAPQRPGRP